METEPKSDGEVMDELRQLMADGTGNDFTVLDYEAEVMP
jgi:hypothetical protein